MASGGTVRCGRWLPALALAAIAVFPRPVAAGPIMGTSWDGPSPGTLADISGQSNFSFGLAAFAPGVYAVTWFGGVSGWRNFTTIGAGDQTLFDSGYIAPGTQQTVTMTDSWTMWATTPDLSRAESTGGQWAFTSIGPQQWAWGLEDIALGRCDCDYQDAYGMLARIGDVTAALDVTSDSHDGLQDSRGALQNPPGGSQDPPGGPQDPPTPLDHPRTVDDVPTPVPEPGTIALVVIGLASLGARRRLRQR